MLRKSFIATVVFSITLGSAQAATPFLDDEETALAERIKEIVLALPQTIGQCRLSQPEFLEELGMDDNENAVSFTVTNGDEMVEMQLPIPVVGGPFFENFVDEQNGTFRYRSEMIVKWTTMWKTFDYEVRGQFDATGIKDLTVTKYTFVPRNDAFGLPGYWYRDLIDQQEISCARQ
jgi:hypothetical protein